MMLASDAAGFIDPFTGDGISLALRSGTLAAESLTPFFLGKFSLSQAHQHYRDGYHKRFAPAFRNAARIRLAFSATSMAQVRTDWLGRITQRGEVDCSWDEGAPVLVKNTSCRI